MLTDINTWTKTDMVLNPVAVKVINVNFFIFSFLQVTSGMVISTFLSAPIMYVSAWLLTIPLMDPTPLVTELENVSFNISIISLIGLVSDFVASLIHFNVFKLPQ